MNFKLYKDVSSFNDDIYGLLMENEAANAVFLGDLAVGILGDNSVGWRDTSKWVMAAAEYEGRAVLAALMVGGDRMRIYAKAGFDGRITAAHMLAKEFKNAGVVIPGIVSEASLGLAFSRQYTACEAVKYTKKEERIYRLDRCFFNPARAAKGRLRRAKASDLAFIPYWREDFFGKLGAAADLDGYEAMISAKNLYILEDGGVPVSMARIDQKLENICGLGLIYTPPYFRNKGYGASVTARLSKICLDERYSCVLSADLSNPVSNGIYQKLGYRQVCDLLLIDFEG